MDEDFDFEPEMPSDDYDIYSGANWTGEEDGYDARWDAPVFEDYGMMIGGDSDLMNEQ